MKTSLIVMAVVYTPLAVVQALSENWSMASADLLIAALAVGFWFTLRELEQEKAGSGRLRVEIMDKLNEPKRATVYYDGVPIFAGRDYSADIAGGTS